MAARSALATAIMAGLVVFITAFLLIHLELAGFGSSSWGALGQSQGGNSSNGTSGAGAAGGGDLLLGLGKADITGPTVEINFMGYANGSQLGTGLRQRLYSRAFIVASASTPQDRWAYLVLDTQSGDTAIRHGILDALTQLGPEYAVYGNQNVAVTGTHSHSGPGAWLNYLLPQVTSKGFNKESYQAIVDGAVESIKRAHQNLSPGSLSVGSAEIVDGNANRSPYAYLANPEEERAGYQYDTDKEITVLRFTQTNADGTARDAGILTWFPVHGTSMLGNNTIVTADNKGVAAHMFEQAVIGSSNNSAFIAGFSQANVGDTTPNVMGAYCEYGEQAGQMCDFKTSLCGNISQPCHGRGPYWGRNDYGTASAYEIGRRQFAAAWSVFNNGSAFSPVSSSAVKATHHFVDLSVFHFTLPNGTDVKTCPAALGYSFAAGTTDGPGAFDFKQNDPGAPDANPLWSVVGGLIAAPNDTQKECQYPKPILLDVGETDTPYAWAPNIVDIQSLRVGNFFVVVSPGEATTMSGRRWKNAMRSGASTMLSAENSTAHQLFVVLGAPANSYTHYIATPEEYGVQRYEGASTLYGPHTLDAYINLTLSFLPDLDASAVVDPSAINGPQPPINTNRSLSFITGVVFDGTPLRKHFGDVTQDVKPTYATGDTISATFVGANPRNNLRLEETFAAVEKYDSDTATWTQVRDDSDWSLLYQWKRNSTVLGTSSVTISWDTAWETGAWTQSAAAVPISRSRRGLATLKRDAALAGRYRLKYYGDSKSVGGTITAFEGTSGEFVIS